MDFLPVSPLPSMDCNLLETLNRLESSINGLTQQVKVLTKEKNDLAERVDALQKQNLELAQKLQSFTGKRLQETTPTNLPMAPPPKRAVTKKGKEEDRLGKDAASPNSKFEAMSDITVTKGSRKSLRTTTTMPPPPPPPATPVVKNPQLPNSIDSDYACCEEDIKQTFWEFAKNYRAFKETSIPGVFTTSVFEESSIERKGLMNLRSTIDQLIAKARQSKLIPFGIDIPDLETIAHLINAILDPKPLSDLIVNRIVRSEKSGKLYSVPDKVLSIAIKHKSLAIHHNSKVKTKCTELLGFFFQNDDIVDFVSKKVCLKYQYATMFAFCTYLRPPINDPDNAGFLKDKRITFRSEVLPGRLVYSELEVAEPPTSAPEIEPQNQLPEIPVPPATPLPDLELFPEIFFTEEQPEPPLTPYGGI